MNSLPIPLESADNNECKNEQTTPGHICACKIKYGPEHVCRCAGKHGKGHSCGCSTTKESNTSSNGCQTKRA